MQQAHLSITQVDNAFNPNTPPRYHKKKDTLGFSASAHLERIYTRGVSTHCSEYVRHYNKRRNRDWER